MQKVPFWPRFLGLAGLLPQIACVLVAFLGPDGWHEAARVLAAFYAALIFTFLGGTWWGIAASAPAAERRNSLAWVWVAAVLPSLLALGVLFAWAAEWISLEPVMVMLGGGLLVALGVDARIAPLAPRWWMALRVPLSVGLGTATIAAALA